MRKCLNRSMILAICIAMLGFAAGSPPVLADQIAVSNLDQPNTVNLTSDGVNFASAGSFSTGNSDHRLASVQVGVHSNTTGSSELRLLTDDAGQPGSFIESLGTKTIVNQAGINTQTYISLVNSTLQANTTYWLTLGETGSGSFQWLGTNQVNDEISPFGWTIGDKRFFRTLPDTIWEEDTNGGNPVPRTPLFAVSVVPEPSTLALCLGLGLVEFARRRRSRKVFEPLISADKRY